jgi:hypothetical protein
VRRLQHEQRDIVAFLQEENRVLKAQLQGRRSLNDDERRRLAALVTVRTQITGAIRDLFVLPIVTSRLLFALVNRRIIPWRSPSTQLRPGGHSSFATHFQRTLPPYLLHS